MKDIRDRKTHVEIVLSQRASQRNIKPLPENVRRYARLLEAMEFDEKIEIEGIMDEFCEKIGKMGVLSALELVGVLGDFMAGRKEIER